MKKIKLENLAVTSFVTTISALKSKTVKGRGLTDDLPHCNPNDTIGCTASQIPACASAPNITCTISKSIIRSCTDTNVAANCPRSGANGATLVGCSQIC